MRRHSSLACLAATTFLAAASPAERMTVGELKETYLACERAAIMNTIEPAGIMECSVVSETLKARAFDGSFRALKAWSDAHLGTPTIGAEAAGDPSLF